VKGEAIALVCGRSWVLQRTGRLTEALADAEESLRLGEHIPWERNTAFCKKCIGRLYRMLAEEELERPAPDQGRVKRLLDDSISLLTEAIRRFSSLEEVGPTHPEVGDCYSLMGRTYLIARKMSESDGVIKKAFNLIPEGYGKDYLDLLILAGDFQARRGNRQDAESFYDAALKIKNENAEMTEMQARAHFARGLNREAMKQVEGALRDISKAHEILKGLGEIRAASRVRWEMHRIQGDIPAGASPLLKPETYTTRVLAIERYVQMKGETKKKKGTGPRVVGRRAAMSAEQLKQIIKEARAQADQEEPKW
jgi:tetratricopeptide (TPR) repeat protein